MAARIPTPEKRNRPAARLTLVVALASLVGTACADGAESSPANPPEPLPQPVVVAGAVHVAVPWHGSDGNRVTAGRGTVPESAPVDVELGAGIVWMVGGVVAGDPIWVVVADDGNAHSVTIPGSGRPVINDLGPAPASGPPILLIDGDAVTPVFPGGAPDSPPGVGGGSVLEVLTDGSVQLNGSRRFDVAALPDARFVFDTAGRALVLGGASDRYPHGVLGDPVEATTISLIDPAGRSAIELVEVGAGEVIEGTSPIWADVDGDGAREVIATVSTPSAGARLVVFDESGAVVAESAPIGRGGRWRHQIAVAPLGPAGELEIVDVLTPHIGGVVEFFRLSGEKLEIVASLSGFTSHFIGSRNLSVPVVADADGDGRLEVVLATQDRRSLAGIVHRDDGAIVAWTAGLGGELSSNLSAVALDDGSLALAAGRSDGTVRIWMPAGPAS